VRVKRWQIALLFLLGCGLVEMSWAGCPLLTHKDPSDEREFQSICQQIATTPAVTTGTGAPTTAPKKVGDFYIATGTGKVYVSSATVSGSWIILN
jgi:hypothetical protein